MTSASRLEQPELLYFETVPKIVPAGKTARITIRPLYDHVRLVAGDLYRVTVFPQEEKGLAPGAGLPYTFTCQPQAGCLSFELEFPLEQEYRLRVEWLHGVVASRVGDFNLYALEADLFERLPFKGDLHMHSSASDGKEAPAYVAAACRQIGLDFMALTDHRNYAASLEAQAAFAGLPVDLRIYPGEEVHAPGNRVHIVNFGGSFSVNQRFADDPAAYQAEVQALSAGLTDLPPDYRAEYASCLWCYRQIQQGGGLAIFCHPYWLFEDFARFNVPEGLIARHLAELPFDALEVVGGYSRREYTSNYLQTARYYAASAAGRLIPAVGVSDAHGCQTGELFGWYYTIAFSPSGDLPDLVRSIRSGYSVAVEAHPDLPPRAHGPFRLVVFAQFLLREVFPWHDQLCAQEGRLMLALLSDAGHRADTARSIEALRACQGQCAGLYRQLWSWPAQESRAAPEGSGRT